ncbi:hypothetical protein N7474_000651 [Penicillium riverlandense]|uniref:uncharacterized protein n=1 Tax=Penicillium riverlandense TaxID=1903569 RepID=UPI002548D4DA|nr:uncharacterized protein N7474_000651 [Penicillium riverlandense]KAJ5832340.1 hypothetical protein N7474_000651 [Penicillium riverlandense]
MFPTRALLGRSARTSSRTSTRHQDPHLTFNASIQTHQRQQTNHRMLNTRLPLPRTLPPPPNTPPIRTQKRGATILPNFVGIRFAVHNGKTYQEVLITEEMVGRKLGEYVATRKRFTYKQSKNK